MKCVARSIPLAILLLVVLYLLCYLGYALKWNEVMVLPFGVALAFGAMFLLEPPRR